MRTFLPLPVAFPQVVAPAHSGSLRQKRKIFMISHTAPVVLLSTLLFLVPLPANAQRGQATERIDSAVSSALASVRKYQTTIRVDTGGPKPVEGIYSGTRDGVLFVWPAPSRRVPFEAINTLSAHRSKPSRGAVIIGAVVGGVFGSIWSKADPDSSPFTGFVGVVR